MEKIEFQDGSILKEYFETHLENLKVENLKKESTCLMEEELVYVKL